MQSVEQGVATALGQVVGNDRVVGDEASLRAFVASYQALSPAPVPAAMVYPRTAEDVQAIVEHGKRAKLNLVAVSSQNGPRTSGSSLPSATEEDTVVVNLSNMKKIIRMDRRNRVAMIEPGVTFPELSAAARDAGMRVAYPLRPRQAKSVVASYLDREPTLIPKHYWEVTDPLLCLEFVLGTGELFRTGSAAGPGTLEEQWASGVSQNFPMGPAFTDLGRAIMGAQGTLGVVTWATVRLDLAPSMRKLYFVGAKDLAELEPCIYGSTRRRLGDEYLLLNNTALASTLADTPDDIRSLRSRLPAWTLILVVAGYEYLPEEKMAYEEKGLNKVAAETGVILKDSLPGLDNEVIFSLLESVEAGTSWKQRLAACSVDVFFTSTLDKAPMFVKTMRELVDSRSFPVEDLGVYIQPTMQGRTAHIEFNVPYAPDNQAKATALHVGAIDSFLDKGAFFSRPHGPASAKVFARVPDHVAMLQKLKSVLDPDHVFNRGKLCF
jgi:FAD/FMN-containing dehydrogenase